MGNGKLRDVPAKAKEKVEKSAERKAFDKWKGLLFAGMNKEWSFGQCSRLYHNSTGEWPRDGWPGTFETGSLAWKRRVNENLTPRDLMIRAKEIERGMSK
jgi:hypothetical protein